MLIPNTKPEWPKIELGQLHEPNIVEEALEKVVIPNGDGSVWRVTETVRDRCINVIGHGEKTREVLGSRRYKRDELRILIYELLYTAWLHKDHNRRSGENYFDAHLIGAIRNIMDDIHLTSVESVLATGSHDDPEDIRKEFGYPFTVDPDIRVRTEDRVPLFYFHDTNAPLGLDNPAEIEEMLGRVRGMVKGMTKIGEGTKQVRIEDAFGRFLQTILAQGIRIAYIKAAGDRMHNMETLNWVKADKRPRIARETLDLYVPLAEMFGIRVTEEKLLQYCAHYLNPTLLRQYHQLIATKQERSQRYQDIIRKQLQNPALPLEIRFEESRLSSLMHRSSNESPFENLVLGHLGVDDRDPGYDVVVLTQTPDVLRHAISKIIQNFGGPEIPPGKDLGLRGQLIRIFNRDLGGRIYFRVNDQRSEAVSRRGILASYPDGKTPPWISDLIRDILRETGRTRANILTTAREKFVKPRITVRTPEGRILELPKGSTALDFAATAFEDENVLKGVCSARVSADLWGNNPRTVSPLAALPSDVVVELEHVIPGNVDVEDAENLPDYDARTDVGEDKGSRGGRYFEKLEDEASDRPVRAQKVRDLEEEPPSDNEPSLPIDVAWLMFCKLSQTQSKISESIPYSSTREQTNRLYRTIASLFKIDQKHLRAIVRQAIPGPNPNEQEGILQVAPHLPRILEKNIFAQKYSWSITIDRLAQPVDFSRTVSAFAKIEEMHHGEKRSRLKVRLLHPKVSIAEFITFLLQLRYDGYQCTAAPILTKEKSTAVVDTAEVIAAKHRQEKKIGKEKKKTRFVTVYTPKKEVKKLPWGATVLDFVQEIHSGFLQVVEKVFISNRSGKDKREISLFEPLPTGVMVHIQKGKESGLDIGWQLFCQNHESQNAIRRYLRRKNEGKEVEEQMQKFLRTVAVVFSVPENRIEAILQGRVRESGVNRIDDLLLITPNILKLLSDLPVFTGARSWQVKIMVPHALETVLPFEDMFKKYGKVTRTQKGEYDKDTDQLQFDIQLGQRQDIHEFMNILMRLKYQGYDIISSASCSVGKEMIQ